MLHAKTLFDMLRGGVHALAGLADDAPDEKLRQTSIDVLSACLCSPSRLQHRDRTSYYKTKQRRDQQLRNNPERSRVTGGRPVTRDTEPASMIRQM
ncbi:hypothetical protein ACF1BE_26685 [Streptomyces sp. NPDC014991]|uniref:hypothetical protein n=1 Tax=Streptomyces sp. NPDC014991 TaxID=3364935 RepID=UPI0036F8D634